MKSAFLFRFLRAFALSLVVTLGLLLLFSAFVFQSEHPLRRIDTCAVLAVLAGSMSCGLFGKRIMETRPALGSVLVYVFYIATLGGGGLFLPLSSVAVWRKVLLIFVGFLLCVLGARVKKTTHQRTRHRKKHYSYARK